MEVLDSDTKIAAEAAIFAGCDEQIKFVTEYRRFRELQT